MKIDKETMLLYAVTDRAWLKGRRLEEDVLKALKGGITLLQLREKDMNDQEMLEEAIAVKALADQYDVPLIINDRVDVCAACGAAGVHIGQSDIGLLKARQKLGADKIIGVTAKSVEQALKAQEQGADYIGTGAVFGSSTKLDTSKLDHEILQQICEAVDIPVVAIGGITRENISGLKGRKMDGFAIVSGIFAQPDIESACRELKQTAEALVQAQ